MRSFQKKKKDRFMTQWFQILSLKHNLIQERINQIPMNDSIRNCAHVVTSTCLPFCYTECKLLGAFTFQLAFLVLYASVFAMTIYIWTGRQLKVVTTMYEGIQLVSLTLSNYLSAGLAKMYSYNCTQTEACNN